MANNGLILYMERGLGNVELPGTEYQMIKEEFDKVCDEQEKIDTSGFGEVYECINEHLLEGKPHPTLYPYTDDKEVLLKALEMTGHGKDEAFCGRFMNHYRLFVKGKELQAKGITILAEHTPQIETYYNFAVLLRNTFELVIINGKESKEPVTDFSIGENRDKTSFMSKPSQLINWGK